MGDQIKNKGVPADDSGRPFDPPGECGCGLCGVVYVPANWREWGFCPDCKIEVGRMLLHAKIHAHKAFADGGFDMYGSQADPNLDRGWLDGYASGVYDCLIDLWKKEHPRVTDRSGSPQASSPRTTSVEPDGAALSAGTPNPPSDQIPSTPTP